ncbi:MAG: response regulator [Desulfobacteraceae bacterium]|nr:response regulator [Desulfobacteraceae bacterium]
MNFNMKNFMCIIICSVLFIIPSKAISASESIILNNNIDEYKIGLRVSILEDKNKSYSIEDIVSKDIEKLFVPSSKEALSYGFTDSAYWVKFTVVNPYDTPIEWLLEASYPMLDSIQLYIKNNHGFEMRQTGDSGSFDTREMDCRKFVFSLKSEPNTQNTYFARFSTSSSMNIGLKIWSPEAYMKELSNEQILLSAFFGSILMMIFYNLLLFISLRVISYLHHVLFMSASTLFLFTLYGLSFQYLWPNSVWWSDNCLPFLILLCNIFCVTFARSFLNTKKATPLFDRILIAYVILNCILIPLLSFFSYAVSIKAATFLAVLAALLPLVISIKLSILMRQARFYLVAWSFLLFGITVFSLKTFGALPSNFLTEYSMNIGLFLEMILLSLGIGDQINAIEKELISEQLKVIFVQQQAFEQQEKNAKEKALLEAQMRQSQKMEALAHLVGGIAHDFNNILTTITGYAELLLMGKITSIQKEEYLYYIISASRRAENLISQILTFNQKSVTENSDILLQPVIIDATVKEVCNFLKRTMPVGIEIEQSINSKSYQVLTDPTNIHQVVMNLCTNAIHSMEKSGGKLLIGLSTIDIEDMSTTTGQLSQGTYLEIAVKDSGEGIDPANIDKIFDPYYTTKELGKGTGLGLSTVHGIVKSYDGEINIESEVGNGSTFKVYFPALQPGKGLKKENLKESAIKWTKRVKMLFLDDEKTITYIYEKLLRNMYDFEITTFNRPHDALKAYDPDVFNIVVTDYKMPKMNGLKFAKKIKEKNNAAKIILCSGNPSSFKDAEVYAVLKKPLRAEKLADVLQEAMSQEDK